MNLPMYCRVCDMITGHEVLGWAVKCDKCDHERQAPVIRWIVLVLLLIGLAAIPVWVFVTAIQMFL